eukprot:6604332-Lingulodinium_polyedra.AAC.1
MMIFWCESRVTFRVQCWSSLSFNGCARIDLLMTSITKFMLCKWTTLMSSKSPAMHGIHCRPMRGELPARTAWLHMQPRANRGAASKLGCCSNGELKKEKH